MWSDFVLDISENLFYFLAQRNLLQLLNVDFRRFSFRVSSEIIKDSKLIILAS